MKRAGFDIGVTGAQTLAWSIRTPGGRAGYGQLNGLFNGSSADASILLGAGTHALFGESGDAIRLDPLSSSGHVGLGFGFGMTGLELQRVPTTAFTSYVD